MVLLESSKLFADLPVADLQSLKQVSQELSFAPKDIIFKEGDAGDGIYIVKYGLVHITTMGAPGDVRVLSKLGPGELFGEMAVLDQQPRSAGASAAELTSVYFVGRDELLKLLDHSPRLASALIREISGRLREFNRQYIREVIESERLALVGRFASSIVHDLKNPLNIIGISADMACMPAATVDARQNYKVRIRKQVERISNMVGELLEFARGSHTNFILARVDYATFVNQLLDEIRPEVALKSATIELEGAPPSIVLQLNPQRLSRVFHNLCGNATDAMPGGGKIKIRFVVNKSDVLTEIEDSGKGIAPEMADKLFQAFATFGKANGTGLGLSICKKIVDDHHGKILARNEPGRGAIFCFHLPIPPG